MPQRHGIRVQVTNTALQPLTEYGSQSMGKSSHLSKIVSSRIEAKDGLQFYILIRSQRPFPLTEADLQRDPNATVSARRFFSEPAIQHNLRPRKFNEHSAIEEQEDLNEHIDDSNKDLSSQSTLTKNSLAVQVQLKNEERPGTAGTNLGIGHPSRYLRSSTVSTTKGPELCHTTHTYLPRSSSLELPSHPPFDLTASVYVDGHEKPEARQVIYLNPASPKYCPGGFVFKGRWVAAPPTSHAAESSEHRGATATTDADQHISIRNWVFRSLPVSVHDLTNRMAICSTNESAPGPLSELDRVLADLTSELSHNTLDATARPKPGQIEIRFRRIVAGTSNSYTPFKAYHYAGADETPETSEGNVGEECTHTTELTTQTNSRGEQERVKLNTVPWKPYKMDEDIYAKFIFNYTDRGKLLKLGLCDEDGTPTLAGRIHVPDFDAKPETRKTRKRDEEDNQDGVELRSRRTTASGRATTRPRVAGWTVSTTEPRSKMEDSSDEETESEASKATTNRSRTPVKVDDSNDEGL